MERKEELVEFPKLWGKEVTVVNNDGYCGKYLYLNQYASSSLHFHIQKTETFHCLEGEVALHIEGVGFMLSPFGRPKTIKPGEKHSFYGITSAIIVEFSTHDNPEDTVRITSSIPAGNRC